MRFLGSVKRYFKKKRGGDGGVAVQTNSVVISQRLANVFSKLGML